MEVLGRTGMRYTENGRTMFLDSEVLAIPAAVGLYSHSMVAWDPPHEKDLVGDGERQDIIGNIRRAFTSQG